MTPQELGALADEYYSVYNERLAADKVARALKTKEEALHAQLIYELRQQNLSAIGGKTILLQLPATPDLVPAISDWDVFCEHLVTTRDFSLIERRVSKSAIRERWDAEVDVPGVIPYPVQRLSKSKVKG